MHIVVEMQAPVAARGNLAMRWFGNLRVGAKISLALAISILAGGLVAGVGLVGLSQANSNATAIYEENLKPTATLAGAQGYFDDELLALMMASIAASAADSQINRDKALKAADLMNTEMKTFADLGLTPAQQAEVDKLDQALTAFDKVRDDQLIPAALTSDNAKFEATYGTTAAPLIATANSAFDALKDFEASSAAQAAAANTDTYESSRRTMIICLIVGFLLAAALGWLTVRRITHPLGEVSAMLSRVADGDLTGVVTVSSRDEVGVMAGSLNRASSSMQTTVQALGTASHSLAAAAEQLSATSTQIAGSAETASNQANAVSVAAEEVSRNVDTVSAGSEEMGASIREIAQNANLAAEVASQAVMMAQTTNQTVSKLGDSSAEIGNVIKLITAIAEQTNLLALNATIEAARAGEMGKGFAVVASEVKDLAQETASATENISTRVTAIQNDTGTAITAIGEISEIIAKISDYQTTIAAAVEEQTATTGEMNRGVGEAASGVGEIAAGVERLAMSNKLTTESVADSQRAASELARMSGELQSLVGTFRV